MGEKGVGNSNSQFQWQNLVARAYDFAVYYLRRPTAKLNFPHSPPKISSASFQSPPQIQAAAAKFAAEEFQVPSQNGAASSSSSSSLEAECDIDGQQFISEPVTTFGDSVTFESMENGGSYNVEDIPPLDVLLEDFGVPCFQQPEDWEMWIF